MGLSLLKCGISATIPVGLNMAITKPLSTKTVIILCCDTTLMIVLCIVFICLNMTFVSGSVILSDFYFTMRTGFVIEFNIRGEDGRVYPNSVISSKHFGEQEFNDLTANNCPSVSIDKDIEGYNSEHDVPVKYDRCFVVVPWLFIKIC